MTGALPVIVDCDPGHDDAIAILLAAGNSSVELLGITTVAGNQTLDHTTRNACAVATLAGLDQVPVVPGCERPLLRPLRTAAAFHGESGLDGPAPIEPKVSPMDGHAVEFLIDTVLARPGEVSIVAVGPLTNVAMALRRAPEIAGAVRQVSVMGGSYTRGNTTPAAEFNIYVDPEAAAIVFGAPWDVTMVGLDVTHQALYTPSVAQRVAALGSPVAAWVGELMAFFGDAYRRGSGMPSPPVHDPCALAALIEPALLEVREAQVVIETTGTHTAGMTVVDFDQRPAVGRHHVGVGIDATRFWDLVVEALAVL
jgi:purine nucleosidase